MKRVWKAVLILSAILLVIGVALTVVSAMTGGSIRRIKTNVAIRDFEMDFAEEDIENLELRISTGSFRVIESDEFRVEAKNIAEEYFTCELSGKTLTVSERWGGDFARNLARGLNLFDYGPEITLYIPRGFQASSVNLSVSAGKCEIGGLSATEVDIDISAGECIIDSIKAGRMDVEISAGSLTVYSMTADNCDVSISAGRAYIGGEITKKADVSCSAGSIQLELTGAKNEYSFNVDVGVGNIIIGGSNYGGLGASATMKGDSGAADISLRCSAGEVVVGFTG